MNRISLSIQNIFGYIGGAARVFSFRQTAASLRDNRLALNIGLFYVNLDICILGFGVDVQFRLFEAEDGEVANFNIELKVPAAYISFYMAVNSPSGMKQYRRRVAWQKQREVEDAQYEARRAVAREKAAATRAKNAKAIKAKNAKVGRKVGK